MSLTIYMTGHGKWDPKAGFTKVPKGCTTIFPIQNGMIMTDTTVHQILRGNWAKAPDMISKEYSIIPNIGWTPITSSERKGDLDAFEQHHHRRKYNHPAVYNDKINFLKCLV
ncbi:MAG: hypothetical protein COA99_09710, partial [Moraxellaceae bacterium]